MKHPYFKDSEHTHTPPPPPHTQCVCDVDFIQELGASEYMLCLALSLRVVKTATSMAEDASYRAMG